MIEKEFFPYVIQTTSSVSLSCPRSSFDETCTLLSSLHRTHVVFDDGPFVRGIQLLSMSLSAAFSVPAPHFSKYCAAQYRVVRHFCCTSMSCHSYDCIRPKTFLTSSLSLPLTPPASVALRIFSIGSGICASAESKFWGHCKGERPLKVQRHLHFLRLLIEGCVLSLSHRALTFMLLCELCPRISNTYAIRASDMCMLRSSPVL